MCVLLLGHISGDLGEANQLPILANRIDHHHGPELRAALAQGVFPCAAAVSERQRSPVLWFRVLMLAQPALAACACNVSRPVASG